MATNMHRLAEENAVVKNILENLQNQQASSRGMQARSQGRQNGTSNVINKCRKKGTYDVFPLSQICTTHIAVLYICIGHGKKVQTNNGRGRLLPRVVEMTTGTRRPPRDLPQLILPRTIAGSKEKK
ncbi:hypothetical protein Fot_15448 [Forsythia ovata]|uniref:Uncharacterized protein n=1 Tax=Forsythia ovata TaxID=205694 RepID=A0ABD1WCT5_9LAMI